MRSDHQRRLKLLEGGLTNRVHGQAEMAALLAWFTNAHGHHCEWDVFERMATVPYIDRAGIVCDYVEAIGKVDPEAAAVFWRRCDGNGAHNGQ